MALGDPMTRKYQIGTAEVRVGPLSDANKLTQKHSVGLLDSVTINVNQESVNLEGGFPRRIMDSSIVSQTIEVSATLREYSLRNMRLMMGEGAEDQSQHGQPFLALTTEDAKEGSTELKVLDINGFNVGDLVVVVPKGKPEALSICKIQDIRGDLPTSSPVVGRKGGNRAKAMKKDPLLVPNAGSLIFSQNTPLLFDYAAAVTEVYQSQALPLGASEQEQYMSLQVIQREHSTGRPIIFNCWKAKVTTGMEYQSNAEDFTSNEITLSVMEPNVEDFAIDSPLEHLAGIIPHHPTGMMVAGG